MTNVLRPGTPAKRCSGDFNMPDAMRSGSKNGGDVNRNPSNSLDNSRRRHNSLSRGIRGVAESGEVGGRRRRRGGGCEEGEMDVARA